MSEGKWSSILAVLFLAILGWYLVTTEQTVRAFRADTEMMMRMYAEVQAGLGNPESNAPEEALIRILEEIDSSGVPLVWTSRGDTVISANNLPFEADLNSAEGQVRVLEYSARMDVIHAPVRIWTGDLVHFGDPPGLQRLRWVPWLQVSLLLFTFLIGILVIRSQRQAAADRAWTSMARERAHQLGTPISSLKGWLEVLALPRQDRPEGMGERAIAAEIGMDVDRLERVSRRFELIGRKTSLEVQDLEGILVAVERYLRARMPTLGQGVRLSMQIDPNLPQVEGNEVLLTWALENVMKNALDALAGRGGEIHLRAFRGTAGWVTLQVHDTGPGVAPEIRERIFEPGVTTKSGGWGVGLALSRRIVEKIHGGQILLTESGPQGSTFEIHLPASLAEKHESSTSDHP
jgi:signal transduction histidine kinase